MVYVGQTRSRSLIERLSSLGIGEVVQRYEGQPRRFPWFLDNGAFGDSKAGKPFDMATFRDRVCVASYYGYHLLWEPDFIVAPDVVAGGLASLALSLETAPWLFDLIPGVPVYLVVQDGMAESDVAPHLALFGGLFVGGSIPWKVATGAAWVRFGHERGLPVHIGRVGTPKRVQWAERVGADSIDSSLPLWSEGNLQRFLGALDPTQGELFGGIV
jgi:hypothetical protein